MKALEIYLPAVLILVSSICCHGTSQREQALEKAALLMYEMPDSAMSYGNQYLHDRNLVRFGYTDPAPLSSAVLRSEDTVIDGKDTTLHWLDEAYREAGSRLLQDGFRSRRGQDQYCLEGQELCHADPYFRVRVQSFSGHGPDSGILIRFVFSEFIYNFVGNG